MTKKIASPFSPKYLVLGAAGMILCGLGAPALAQDSATLPNEQITVEAPHFTMREQQAPGIGQSFNMPAMLITVSRPVNYSDLDLSKDSDMSQLQIRIHDTAQDACNELDRRFSPLVYVDVKGADCVKSATEQAMATVNQTIANKAGG